MLAVMAMALASPRQLCSQLGHLAWHGRSEQHQGPLAGSHLRAEVAQQGATLAASLPALMPRTAALTALVVLLAVHAGLTAARLLALTLTLWRAAGRRAVAVAAAAVGQLPILG